MSRLTKTKVKFVDTPEKPSNNLLMGAITVFNDYCEDIYLDSSKYCDVKYEIGHNEYLSDTGVVYNFYFMLGRGYIKTWDCGYVFELSIFEYDKSKRTKFDLYGVNGYAIKFGNDEGNDNIPEEYKGDY